MANVFLQHGFSGGVADDRFAGIRDSFQSAKGVEIRKNPSSLKLAHKTEKETGSVVTDLILVMVTLKDSGKTIGFGDTGQIYRRVSGTWTQVYNQSAKILGAYEYNGYLYYATSTHLHRITVGNAVGTWSGNVVANYKAFANNSTIAHPMIEANNKLYVGDGSTLAELDSLGTWTDQMIDIFGDETIIGITFAGSMLRLYARKSNAVDHGRAYLWDGVQDSYNETIAWDDLTIHAVYNKSGKDYVLAGKRPSLYVSTGYQRALLKRLPNVTSSLEINPYGMCVFDDLLVVGVAASGDTTIGRGAWTWGQLNKDYPEVLNNEYPTSNDSVNDVIGCVHQSDGELLISWRNGSNYGVDVVKTSKYMTTGEVISRVYDGGGGGIEKEIQKVDMVFQPIRAGEKIQLYARTNFSSSWGNPIITVDYEDTADRDVCLKRGELPVADFSVLETKLVLTAGTSQATTPEVFEVAVSYQAVKIT